VGKCGQIVVNSHFIHIRLANLLCFEQFSLAPKPALITKTQIAYIAVLFLKTQLGVGKKRLTPTFACDVVPSFIPSTRSHMIAGIGALGATPGDEPCSAGANEIHWDFYGGSATPVDTRKATIKANEVFTFFQYATAPESTVWVAGAEVGARYRFDRSGHSLNLSFPDRSVRIDRKAIEPRFAVAGHQNTKVYIDSVVADR
jgi:hypothetical protein